MRDGEFSRSRRDVAVWRLDLCCVINGCRSFVIMIAVTTFFLILIISYILPIGSGSDPLKFVNRLVLSRPSRSLLGEGEGVLQLACFGLSDEELNIFFIMDEISLAAV